MGEHIQKSRRQEAQRVAALASPIRIEIIGAFQTHGPSSIRELAAQLARPADGLYHHVRLLVKIGVVVEKGRCRVGRRDEVVYTLTSPRVSGGLNPASPASKEGVKRAAAAALRLAMREIATAVEVRDAGCKDGGGLLRVSRQRVWLTDEAIRELHQLLGRFETFISSQNKRKQGRLFAVTTVLTPLFKRKRF